MLAKCALLIAALVPAALGATSTHAVAPSGLRGVVTRSPIMPVCMEGVPCSAPAKNTPLVFFRRGRSVRTRTNSVGRYRVALAPGWWSVRTATVRRLSSGIEPHTVRVFAARFRVVNLDIDTGIR
jgi:hypothetical protein